ncbi:MAG: hypothetical protein COB02_12860 [Candidatus Cloacimonadota bacterium]|nr:MAG: hypothetical protein COB02_12860 [Candidatus Cloacimonadota bacterium]
MRLFLLLFLLLNTINCAKDITFTQNKEVLQELISLSNTATITSMEILEKRVSGVKNLFGDVDNRSGVIDPRGTFPTIYQVTTTQGLKDILNSEAGNGPFQNPKMMRCFTVEFGKLYLDNLHKHLTGATPSQGWQVYYDAAKTNTPILEILGIGVNVHVNLDLTQALLNCEAPNKFKDDFMKGGTSLVTEIPRMSEDIYTFYRVDKKLTEGFFKIFAVGDAGDYIFKLLRIKSSTSYAIFQSLRYISFQYHSGIMATKNPKWYTIFPKTKATIIRKSMQATWTVSNFVIKEVLFELQEHGFKHTSTHIGKLIWNAVKKIKFNFNLFSKKDSENNEEQTIEKKENTDILESAFF